MKRDWMDYVGYEDEWGRLYASERPEGWREVSGATTAPVGFKWVCNGVSRFSLEGKYRHMLVRVDD